MYNSVFLGLAYNIANHNGDMANILGVLAPISVLALFVYTDLTRSRRKKLEAATQSKISTTSASGFFAEFSDFVADCTEKTDLKAASLQSERFVETKHKTESGGVSTIKDNETGVEYLLYRGANGGVTMIPLIKGVS